jgi:sugar lactone lactonase YvrE
MIKNTANFASAMAPQTRRKDAWVAAALLLNLLIVGAAQADTYNFQILAGNGSTLDHTDGTGTNARFFNPTGAAVDAAGNIYIADAGDHTIRKVTAGGVVATLAGTSGQPGSADGTGTAATFLYPYALAVDGAGNVYVADSGNMNIRKVTAAGVVTTLAGFPGQTGSADGTGSAARFNAPQGIAVDGAGNVYVSDTNNSTIRLISPAGMVTTLAGSADKTGSVDGSGNSARFNYPFGITVDGGGNVYVADFENSTIRKITGGNVTTLAGSPQQAGSADGQGNAAQFNHPEGVSVDGAGNVYVIDTSNQTVRKISPGGSVSTLAGTPGLTGQADGLGWAARFFYPGGIAVDGAGNVYVADTGNHSLRVLAPSDAVTTVAGSAGQEGGTDGTGRAALFAYPDGVAVDGAGNAYIADTNNNTIRKMTAAGVVTTLAGTAGPPGSADGSGGGARFNSPTGVAVDGGGNLYIADAGNSTIRKITAGGAVSTLAGQAGSGGSADGGGAAARFNAPEGIAVDGAGNVYVADTNNSTIRKIAPNGSVTTLAGAPGQAGSGDGNGGSARFDGPYAVAVDGSGNVYVADFFNATIRKITSGGAVTTLAGTAQQPGYTDATGVSAKFNQPYGLAVDGGGNIFVSDTYNRAVRKITPGGVVSTINGQSSRFYYPQGIAVNGSGNLYVADGDNQAINVGVFGSPAAPPSSSPSPTSSGDVPPVASIAVDGHNNGDTISIASGGSTTVTIRYSATDASNNLSGIRYNIWNPPAGSQTPFAGFFSNGNGFAPETGGSGQISQVMSLTAGDWYFWTDAQNSNGDSTSTGAWTGGYILHVAAP